MGTCTLPHGEVANTELGVAEPTAGGTPSSSPDATRPTSPAGGSAWSCGAVELAWRLADVERRLSTETSSRFSTQLDVVREALAAAAAATGPDRGRYVAIAGNYLANVEERLELLADPMALSPGDHIRFSGRTVRIARIVGRTDRNLVLEIVGDGEVFRRACVGLWDLVRLVPPVAA